MKCLCWFVVILIAGGWTTPQARAQKAAGDPRPAAAEQLFAMANQARAQAGVGRLTWDPDLTKAALKHCRWMAAEGPIAHRYGGEQGVAERTSAAGAHFSLIEENVAVGPYPSTIHEGWMNSPGHRENLLNPQVNHVGIAVVAHHGVLYAVADYSRAVAEKTPPQVEAAVADLIRMSGIRVLKDPHDARLACAMNSGLPHGLKSGEPGFVMRWQGADLGHLPQPLVDRLGSGQYHAADIGSCPSQSVQQDFASYRIAVLLY